MTTASARARNARAKGHDYEREIARDLRQWLGDDWTVRRLRAHDQRRGHHAGEFAIDGPFTFPFAIECKSLKTLDLRQLWRTPVDGPMPSWWAQAARQAHGCSKAPLLVMRVLRGEDLAVLRSASLLGMGLGHWVPQMRLVLPTEDFGVEHLAAIPWRHLVSVDPAALAELPSAGAP